MTWRAWVVGQNEGPILGLGWYDRCPDWFGLPFRESFPEAELRLPRWSTGDSAVLLLASYLALFREGQSLTVEWGDWSRDFTLSRPETDCGWQTIRFPCPDSPAPGCPPCLRLRTEGWRHADLEDLPDFRPVGVLFGGIFLETGTRE